MTRRELRRRLQLALSLYCTRTGLTKMKTCKNNNTIPARVNKQKQSTSCAVVVAVAVAGVTVLSNKALRARLSRNSYAQL